MPIKFRCPECQGKIRVADEFAGKRGKCPTCQRFVDIPVASTIPDESAGKPATEEAKKASAVTEAKKASAIAEAKKGSAIAEAKKGSGVAQAETASDVKEAPDSGKASGTVKSVWRAGETVPDAPEAAPVTKEPSGGHKTAASFIKFNCPNCEKPTGFPENLAGMPATCPLCGVRIMVPETSGGESFVVGALPPGARVAPRSPALRPAPPADGAPAAALAPAPAGSPPWALIVLGVAALVVIAALVGVIIGRGTAPETKTAAAPAPALVAPPTPPALPPPPAHTPEPVTKSSDAPPLQTIAELAKKALQATPPVTPPDTQPAETPKEQPKPEEKPAAESKTAPLVIPTETPKAVRKEDEEEEVATKKEPPKKAEPGTANPLDQPPAKPAEPATLPPVVAPPPGPVCAQCYSTGYVPLANWRPYAHLFGEGVPDPMQSVPWQYCPKCQKGKENKELLLAEADRLQQALAANRLWDEIGGKDIKFLHFDTHHLTLHCQLPTDLAKKLAATMEKLVQQLEMATHSILLTQTRPTLHELVVTWDDASYNIIITALEKKSPGGDWNLSRKAKGFTGRDLSVYNAEKGVGGGPESMAIHSFSKMLMHKACGGKCPDWLNEGFAAYCENRITGKNLCISFSYEKNDVKYSDNWNQEIRKYAVQGKLKTWDTVFMSSLIGQKAIDYLTFYSMVCFLMTDPQKFCLMVTELRDGADSAKAIEKAYGLPVKDLQMRWAQWAVIQR